MKAPIWRSAFRGGLVWGGDAEGFHFAVEVGAFEADGGGGLGHVPAIFLEFPQNNSRS